MNTWTSYVNCMQQKIHEHVDRYAELSQTEKDNVHCKTFAATVAGGLFGARISPRMGPITGPIAGLATFAYLTRKQGHETSSGLSLHKLPSLPNAQTTLKNIQQLEAPPQQIDTFQHSQEPTYHKSFPKKEEGNQDLLQRLTTFNTKFNSNYNSFRSLIDSMNHARTEPSRYSLLSICKSPTTSTTRGLTLGLNVLHFNPFPQLRVKEKQSIRHSEIEQNVLQIEINGLLDRIKQPKKQPLPIPNLKREEDLEDQLSNLTSKLQQVEQELNERRKNAEKLKIDGENTERELNEIIKKYEIKIAHLEFELRHQKSTEGTSSTSTVFDKATIIFTGSQTGQIMQELENTKHSLDDLQSDYDKIKKKNASLLRKIENQQLEIESFQNQHLLIQSVQQENDVLLDLKEQLTKQLFTIEQEEQKFRQLEALKIQQKNAEEIESLQSKIQSMTEDNRELLEINQRLLAQLAKEEELTEKIVRKTQDFCIKAFQKFFVFFYQHSQAFTATITLLPCSRKILRIPFHQVPVSLITQGAPDSSY